jgi:hypothetical protein
VADVAPSADTCDIVTNVGFRALAVCAAPALLATFFSAVGAR